MALIQKYYTNGEASDKDFVGLTLANFTFDDEKQEYVGVQMSDGKPFFGYLAVEISKEEYDAYVAIFAGESNPKLKLNCFRNGLLDVKTHKAMEKAIGNAADKNLLAEAEALRPAFERAKRIAKTSGGTAIDVLRDFRPDIKETILEKLEVVAKEWV